MDVNSITLGQITGAIIAIGVFSGFFGKFFSQIYKIKNQDKRIDTLEKRMDDYECNQKKEKDEIYSKVEETNTAVNLLCTAISALIDNEINVDGNIEALKKIKNKLDEKKEIV